MITVKQCPICQSTDYDRIVVARDMEWGLPGEFLVVRCKNCTVAYDRVAPSPAELSSYYTPEYRQWGSKGSRSSAIYSRLVMPLIRPYREDFFFNERARANGSRPRALDVGSGAGHLSRSLARIGWDVTAVDFTPAAFTATNFGDVRTLVGDATRLPIKNHSVRLCVASHVIEHLYSPIDALRDCRRTLESDGVLLVGVPNFDGADRARFGLCWNGWSIPRHLVHFNRASLATAFKCAGFSDVAIRTAPTTGWGKNVSRKLGIGAGSFRNGWAADLLNLIGLPVEYVDYILGRSDGLLAVARVS